MAKKQNQKSKLVLTKVGIKYQKFGIPLCGTTSFYVLCSIFYVLFVTGCGPPKRSCPALADAVEGQKFLADYAAKVKPLRATGSCTLNYINEKGEKFTQSFPIRIWYIDSGKFCIYGDVFFNPRGVCFAVSDEKYWVYAKPMGISVKGAVNSAGDDYFSNPALLVDFLRAEDSECEKIAFTKNGIVCQAGQKQIFIDTCTGTVNKIIYVGQNSKPLLVIDAEKYEKVSDSDFLFPCSLGYEYYDKKNGKNRMEIKLDSVKLWHPEEQQTKALFTPPVENEFKESKK
ncbi:MAG: hypothetical protein LLF92_08285 [Planctomycetaceae bacterium]|nr:hypothetical protein [Planctomycetaceae bacterium]